MAYTYEGRPTTSDAFQGLENLLFSFPTVPGERFRGNFDVFEAADRWRAYADDLPPGSRRRSDAEERATGYENERRRILRKPRTPAGWAMLATGAILGTGLLVYSFAQFYNVGPGQEGVEYHKGFTPWAHKPGLEERSIGEGAHWYLPWETTPKVFETRMQVHEDTLPSGTKGTQEVNVSIGAEFEVEKGFAWWIEKNVKDGDYLKLLKPKIAHYLKTITAEYTAEEAIGEAKRAEIGTRTFDLLKPEFAAYHLNLLSFTIPNIDPTPALRKAIEDKKVAEQTIQTEQFLANASITRAYGQAESVRVTAKGDADAERIRAEGKADAWLTQLKIIEAHPQALRLEELTKWNGAYPIMVGADAPVSLLLPPTNQQK